MSEDADRAVSGVKLSLDLVLGRLNDTMDSVNSGIDLLKGYFKAARQQVPIQRRLNSSLVTDTVALTYYYIDMGGPTTGRVWDVMRYTVSGADPFTTVAGSVISFIGRAAPQNGNAQPPGYLDLLDLPAGSLPNSDTFGRDTITLLEGDHLIFAFKGLPANTSILATTQVLEYREDLRRTLGD
jgi:hypothetical protein